MTAYRVLAALVLVANCAMLVRLSALMREWVADNERRSRAVPDAEASVQATLERIAGKLDALLAGGMRIEAASVVVADDLASAHVRADEAVGPHGAAADAASRTGET